MDVTALKPDGIFFAMGRSRSRVHDKSNDLEGIALLLGVSNEVLTRSGMLKLTLVRWPLNKVPRNVLFAWT